LEYPNFSLTIKLCFIFFLTILLLVNPREVTVSFSYEQEKGYKKSFAISIFYILISFSRLFK